MSNHEFETAIPLEESISNFRDMGALLEGFSVSIRPPAIEMPLLKRLGAANFVLEPGLEGYLRQAMKQSVGRRLRSHFAM